MYICIYIYSNCHAAKTSTHPGFVGVRGRLRSNRSRSRSPQQPIQLVSCTTGLANVQMIHITQLVGDIIYNPTNIYEGDVQRKPKRNIYQPLYYLTHVELSFLRDQKIIQLLTGIPWYQETRPTFGVNEVYQTPLSLHTS